jgi:HEAT repeat protein
MSCLIALAVCLTGCGQEARYRGKSVTSWQKGLGAVDAKERRDAADAIGHLGPSASATIPSLVDMLKDADLSVRAKAAAALWSMGPAARSAVPSLQNALEDPSPEVRLNAAGALGEIGPKAADAAADLARVLRQDTNANVRAFSAVALAKIHSGDDESIGALTQALDDRDNNVRIKAAYALGDFGQSAKNAAPALERTRKSATGALKGASAYALKKIEGK